MSVHSWGDKLFQGWQLSWLKMYPCCLHLPLYVSHMYLPFHFVKVPLCKLKFSPCSIWDMVTKNSRQELFARTAAFHRVGNKEQIQVTKICEKLVRVKIETVIEKFWWICPLAMQISPNQHNFQWKESL